MRSEPVDELLLIKYLLGHLTEEEQIRVEDRAFAEPGYLRALEAAEADLVDDYVRGELSQADRQAFERRFLTSPLRRKKVEFARALATVTAGAPSLKSTAEAASTWHVLRGLIRGWNPALRFAGALAALLCIAGGVWLVLDNTSMRSHLSALEGQHREWAVRDQRLRQELSDAQKRADSLAAQMQSRPSTQDGRTPMIASLVLVAGPSRSESRVEQLVLDRGVQVVHIQIQLGAGDVFRRFRATLNTRSGREILVLSNLAQRRTGVASTMSLDVPASALETGEYELALQGLPDGQDAQDIGYYYFRVQKP
jgi:hypothetical protein